jgi:adenylate cyclase
VERKLTAILCADVYGYSRLMGEDEEATFSTLASHRKIIGSLIAEHHGRFVASAGDSVLAEFASVVNAVQCGIEIQTVVGTANTQLRPERRMEFRIGVNLGDVIVDSEQIYGVNVAARLESRADPGGICISGIVYEQVRDRLALSYEDRGEQSVKNIARPVHVWRVMLDGTGTPARRLRPGSLRRGVFSLTGLAIAVAILVLVQHLSVKPPHISASTRTPEKAAPTLASIPSIAVLPFSNLSGDPRQEYFSDGISDQLINQLSRLPGLFVIARNSSFSYKGKSIKEQELGRELGVKYVLEGSVHKATDQLRIGVALVDTTSGAEIWTASYDRPLKDVFEVQDEIVRRVVTTLGLILRADQLGAPHWWAAPTDNLEAFDDWLRAYQYMQRYTGDDNARARQWTERAIELDPNFSDAYGTLGWIYFFDSYFHWSDKPQASIERSINFGEKALRLDDSNCGALALLSNDYQFVRQFERGVAEGKRAVSINPNCSIGYTFLSTALTAAGKPAEALDAIEKAMRLDPAGHDFYAGVIGNAYITMGRYQEAVQSLKRQVAATPNALWSHLNLVIAYIELGRESEARLEVAEVMRISPKYVLPLPEKGPFENVALNRRFDDDLRKAGLK